MHNDIRCYHKNEQKIKPLVTVNKWMVNESIKKQKTSLIKYKNIKKKIKYKNIKVYITTNLETIISFIILLGLETF